MKNKNLSIDQRSLIGSFDVSAPSSGEQARAANDMALPRIAPRDRIVDRWVNSAAGRFAAVYAPIGFGKTMLLQQIRHGWTGAGGACIHLDGDLAPDGAYLAEILYGAVAHLCAGMPDTRSLMPLHNVDPRRIVSEVARALAGNAKPFLIVIDDYDRFAAPGNNETLRLCVKALPSTTRFVIASRNRIAGLSVDIASLLLEIGPNELRLMPSEIAESLSLPYESDTVAQIFRWTSGWPLAVKLAHPYVAFDDPGAFKDLILQDSADVAGLLASEALKSLPQPHYLALLKSAFLDRFHPDLLSEALDVENSWQVCEALERDYFLISRRGDSQWYEAHPFLQRIAYRHLRGSPAIDLKHLQVRAAGWFNRQGDLHAAMSLSIAAGNFNDAVQMLLDAGGVFLALRKGFDTLKSALSLLPRDHRRGVERLILAEAIVMMREGRLTLAADLVDGVKTRIALGASDGDDPYLRRDLAYVQVTISYLTGIMVDDVAIAALQAALDNSGAEDFWLRGQVHHRLAVTYCRAGDFQTSLRHIEMSRHYFDAGNAPHAAAHSDVFTGVIKLEMGDTAGAAGHYLSALEQFTTGSALCARGAAIAHAHLAEYYAETDQLGTALLHADACSDVLGSGETVYEYRIAATHAQSLIITRTRGVDPAIAMLAEHAQAAEAGQLPDVARYITLRRLQLDLASQDMTARVSRQAVLAAQLLGDREICTYKEQHLVVVTRALMALVDGAEATAINLLEAELAASAGKGRSRSALQTHLMLCVLHEMRGARPAALEALRRAIVIGAETGLKRVFDELGAIGPALLKQLIASRLTVLTSQELDFVGMLLARDPTLSDARGGLTEREVDIFRLVGAGRSNKVIARDLGVSPDTVRYHLKNVYEKLGTHDRSVVRRLAQATDP
ncbi:MAG: LuxR C-terminal-related transcriptional regulator [Tardiphaga sp.]